MNTAYMYNQRAKAVWAHMCSKNPALPTDAWLTACHTGVPRAPDVHNAKRKKPTGFVAIIRFDEPNKTTTVYLMTDGGLDRIERLGETTKSRFIKGGWSAVERYRFETFSDEQILEIMKKWPTKHTRCK